MHSSRMRTARLLPVSLSMHCSGGDVPGLGGTCSGGYLVWGAGVPGTGGCTWSRRGGVPGPEGVPGPGGTCKNITLPQTSFAGSKKFHKVALVCGRARGCQSDVSVAPLEFDYSR